MQPDKRCIAIKNNIVKIKAFLQEVVLTPRLNIIKWAAITKQSPNIKIGYPAQHLASLVTGMPGEKTGARGNDLVDGSEVKACSRIDQLDKCQDCGAAVARLESVCSECSSIRIRRNNDSKWLITVKNEKEVEYLLNKIPRIVFILADYPRFEMGDYSSIRFQSFEIWPRSPRNKRFRELIEHYYHQIFLEHIKKDAKKTPAPKNFWPYSYQFYLCNPIQTFHCSIDNVDSSPIIKVANYVNPEKDRSSLPSVAMPIELLRAEERNLLKKKFSATCLSRGVTEEHRTYLKLRDTDWASPQTSIYVRGKRG